ncbi:hypothetical protein MWN33_05025 [Starkeya koreensis]|uniref:Uncharacterized protein n=1 Tax=Ancylobacter koreensis TaxID=266121 RepID=A0ABT0DJE0_9HYPH|nr:hypothetical protein [Ancylobacter koreensis]MCK0207393.1 hypothetical protein [Ancylobacter koreensis]
MRPDDIQYADDEMPKRFVVYRLDIDNRPSSVEGEYDTIEEVLAHKWRLDRSYSIRVDRIHMNRIEFDRWVLLQKKH